MPPKPCEREGCTKGAQSGGPPHCIAHGGGRRCKEEDCTKLGQGGTGFCIAHGGGRRCQHLGCPMAAIGGGRPHCIAHGGGRRCQEKGCSKAAAVAELRTRNGSSELPRRIGGIPHCMAHGGGKRCQKTDCFELVVRGSVYCGACLRKT